MRSTSPDLPPAELEVLEALVTSLPVECRRVAVAPVAGVRPDTTEEPLFLALREIEQDLLVPLRQAALDLRERNASPARLTESQRRRLTVTQDPRPGYRAPRCKFKLGRAGLDDAGELAIGYVVLRDGDQRRRILHVLRRHHGRWVLHVGWDLDLVLTVR